MIFGAGFNGAVTATVGLAFRTGISVLIGSVRDFKFGSFPEWHCRYHSLHAKFSNREPLARLSLHLVNTVLACSILFQIVGISCSPSTLISRARKWQLANIFVALEKQFGQQTNHMSIIISRREALVRSLTYCTGARKLLSNFYFEEQALGMWSFLKRVIGTRSKLKISMEYSKTRRNHCRHHEHFWRTGSQMN